MSVSVWLILSSSLLLSLSSSTFLLYFASSFNHFSSVVEPLKVKTLVFPHSLFLSPIYHFSFFHFHAFLFHLFFFHPCQTPSVPHLKGRFSTSKDGTADKCAIRTRRLGQSWTGNAGKDWGWSRTCKSSLDFVITAAWACLAFHIGATAARGSYLWQCVSKASFWVMKNK